MLTHSTPLWLRALPLALAAWLLWTAPLLADGPGQLDPTFGGDGVVTTTVGSGDAGAFDLALQPDGKLVTVGISDDGSHQELLLARYQGDGTLDPAFGTAGIVTTTVGNGAYGFALARQPDSNMVISGISGRDIPATGKYAIDLLLARYRSQDGQLDSTFGLHQTGVVTTPFQNNLVGTSDLVLQSDGQIVVVTSVSNPASKIVLLRYRPDGVLDSTFGLDQTGLVTPTLASSDATATTLAVQPDDRLVVAGSSDGQLLLLRFEPDGQLDSTFGPHQTGLVTATLASHGTYPGPVALQPDGKILVAGQAARSATESDAFVARFTPAGQLDPTFNGTGVVTAALTPGWDGAFGLALQPDGRLVVGCNIGGDVNNETGELALLRYTPAGQLDPTFGPHQTGVVTTSLGSAKLEGWNLARQADGRPVVAGYSNGAGGPMAITLLRYLGDPRLALTKQVNLSTPQPGQPLTYTLTVNNSGSSAASELVVLDPLPEGLSLAGPVGLLPAQPQAVLATHALSLPTLARRLTLPAGGRLTLTLPVSLDTDVPAGTILTNSATVSSALFGSASGEAAVTVTAGEIEPPAFFLPLLLKK